MSPFSKLSAPDSDRVLRERLRALRGKSTALALLHRAFDPQSGSVKIDGMDIRALVLAGLRRNIGVVFQEALLFNRSIQENLQVGKPDASEEEMREACQGAQALDIIEQHPEHFLAQVGERHVVVAVGRDYGDVPPLKGIYRGAPSRIMRVSVTLTRLQ